MIRATQGVTFNHGIEEEDVGILEVLKYERCIKHSVKGTADGNEVGDELVRVVKMVAKDVGMDLSELGSRFLAVEQPENPPLNLSAPSVHMKKKEHS